ARAASRRKAGSSSQRFFIVNLTAGLNPAARLDEDASIFARPPYRCNPVPLYSLAMDNTFLRRWLAAFWTVLAVLAGVVFAFRLTSVLQEQGNYYVTTGFEDISIFNISRIRYGDPVYVDCFDYPYRASLFNWFFYWLYGTVAVVVNPSEVALPVVLRLVTLTWAIIGFLALFRFLASRRVDP